LRTAILAVAELEASVGKFTAGEENGPAKFISNQDHALGVLGGQGLEGIVISVSNAALTASPLLAFSSATA